MTIIKVGRLYVTGYYTSCSSSKLTEVNLGSKEDALVVDPSSNQAELLRIFVNGTFVDKESEPFDDLYLEY